MATKKWRDRLMDRIFEVSTPSSGVTQEVLCPFLAGEQEQSGDDCLDADCAAPSSHYKPCPLIVQLSDRGLSCRSSKELVRLSGWLQELAQLDQSN